MKILAIGAAMVMAVSTAAGAQTKAPTTKELYVTICQPCHGPDGKPPVKEMGFVGRAWKTKTVTQSAKTIREGVTGTAMLPMKGRLTEQQILALAKYVRSLDKKPPTK